MSAGFYLRSIMDANRMRRNWRISDAGILAPTGADPNFANVSVLLHCNGTNGSTTFTDSSSFGRTMTASGNAQISTSQSVFGGASALFDGSGDYVSSSSSSDFQMGSGDFTVEGWLKTSTKNKVMIDLRSPGNAGVVFFVKDITGKLGVFTNAGSSVELNGTTDICDGNWHAYAFSRVSGTMYLFVDGVLETSGTMSNNMNSVAQLFFGAQNDGTLSWNGNMDETRITKGVGRYTSTYTVTTSQFPDF